MSYVNITLGRLRFLGTAAMILATTQLSMTACGDAQASMAKPADQPITVPAITLEGDANGAPHPDASSYARKFSGSYAHRIITGGVGHNVPQEAPQAFAQAIVDVDGY